MALSEAYSGSASIGTTEFSLPNNSTTLTPIAISGVYQLFLDLNALTATESYRVAVKEKVRSSSTQRTVFSTDIMGVQAEAVLVAPGLLLLNGWDITIRKLFGTDRTIEWSIRKVA